MELLIKAALGALIVVVLHYFSHTENYEYLNGLVPLFPTFALLAHVMEGAKENNGKLDDVVLFGMLSLLPYFVYLLGVFFFSKRVNLPISLFAAVCCWVVAAFGISKFWGKF